jgi:choline dehydrogenase
MMPVSLHLLENRTPGRVGLVSTDPTADPLIEPALLKHPDDVGAVLRAMAFVTRLTAHPALQPFYGSLIQPADGDDWEEYIQSSFGVYWHGVATCRFGLDGDPGAVVSPELRIRGLANAWVGDASALPTVPHANTNVAVVTVAERAAQLITAD